MATFDAQLTTALAEQQCFIVKGATGSGKTWLVQKLHELLDDGVVMVPQYPMFRPQLRVSTFVGMLPLPAPAKAKLLSDLDAMGVPTDKLVGGKLLGMMDVPGLSGGQRKKLLLALVVQIALTRGARAVVLDEPFAGIDAKSMHKALEVIQEVQEFKDMKLFIVTHDHFELIDAAFPGTTYLRVDSRRVTIDNHVESENTLHAAQLIARTIDAPPPKKHHHKRSRRNKDSSDADGAAESGDSAASAMSTQKNGHKLTTAAKTLQPPKWLDLYVVKRHFIEGEFMLPFFTILTLGALAGVAVARYKGEGEGIVRFSAIYAFLKIFIIEYIHFGSIINYCYKRSQHLEDYNLLLTRKRDAFVETCIIAIVQSSFLMFFMNALLIGIGPRFWWTNWKVLIVDLWYGVVSTLAYHLLPTIQPNPLIVMGSIFPYVATWGQFSGFLLPREYAPKGARWLTWFSATYHFACATDKATDEIKLQGSNCQSLGIHMAFISPLFYFAAILLIYCNVMRALRKQKAKADLALVVAKVAPDKDADDAVHVVEEP